VGRVRVVQVGEQARVIRGVRPGERHGRMVLLGMGVVGMQAAYTARSKMSSTLTLTDEAVVRLRSVLDNQQAPDGALRVFVSPGGCSGFSYGMSLEAEPADDDEVVEQSGVKVVVDPFSLQYLGGAQIDF